MPCPAAARHRRRIPAAAHGPPRPVGPAPRDPRGIGPAPVRRSARKPWPNASRCGPGNRSTRSSIDSHSRRNPAKARSISDPDTRDTFYPAPPRLLDQMVQQDRLAHTELAAHHQCSALARPHRVEQLVEHPTLTTPVKHDGTGGSAGSPMPGEQPVHPTTSGNKAGNARRCGSCRRLPILPDTANTVVSAVFAARSPDTTAMDRAERVC